MEFQEVKIMPAPNVLNEVVSLRNYKEKLQIKIVKVEDESIEFDIIGIYPGLINAFRRILISELPTMAIEKVSYYSNMTMIPDEVLAHRLGLIPLKADPRMFQYRIPGREGTDRDTLHFELKVKCEKNSNVKYGHKRPSDLYVNHMVTSKDIKWVPIGEQQKLYKESQIGPVLPDIVIAKLKPGLEVHAKMEAVKGIGKDHAKFSPVGTASYRLLPYIELLEEIHGEDVKTLKSCFSPGVIGVKSVDGKEIAVVENPRADNCSRNIFYYDKLKQKVKIGLTKDHFIFSIESVVDTKPSDLFMESVKTLKFKCVTALRLLSEICDKKDKK